MLNGIGRQANLARQKMESVGFKEWALVCEALGRGEQSIILRKGGIAEGRDGFAFKHREFFLFPTFFHEQVEKIAASRRELPKQRDGEIEIRFFAQVEHAATITVVGSRRALEPFHILDAGGRAGALRLRQRPRRSRRLCSGVSARASVELS